MIDQKIIDKAIELTHKEIELIHVPRGDWEQFGAVNQEYGNLYHDLLEMCSLDHAFFGLYRLLGEALVEENYDRAAVLKVQIEITEPLKEFVLDQQLRRIQKGYH